MSAASPRVEPVPRVALDQREAAKALGISVDVLQKMRKRGEGPPHFTMFSKVLYGVDELRTWITARSEPALPLPERHTARRHVRGGGAGEPSPSPGSPSGVVVPPRQPVRAGPPPT